MDAPLTFWLFSLPLGAVGIVAMCWVALSARVEDFRDD